MADNMLGLIEGERQLFADKSAARIYMGGTSMGAATTEATFMKYTGSDPLGGVFPMFNWTPLAAAYWHDNKTVQSQIPMLRW